MKIAILGTVHPKGLEFLKENELEIVELTNFNKQKPTRGIKVYWCNSTKNIKAG